MRTLEQYQTHLDKFGPESLLQSAASDLTEKQLGQLKALMDSRKRMQVFRRGRWVDRKDRKPRACKVCGLDLPVDSRTQRVQHDHCRNAAGTRRWRAAKAP